MLKGLAEEGWQSNGMNKRRLYSDLLHITSVLKGLAEEGWQSNGMNKRRLYSDLLHIPSLLKDLAEEGGQSNGMKPNDKAETAKAEFLAVSKASGGYILTCSKSLHC